MVCFAKIKNGPVNTSSILMPLIIFFVDLQMQNTTYASKE